MSSEEKKFTKEEKTAIALKAASMDAAAKQELAKEHGVTVEIIDDWMHETGIRNVSESDEEFSLEASDDFARNVEYGAAFDNLNYRRLTFWSIFGTAVILIMILAIMAIHDYTVSGAEQARADESTFYNIEELRQLDRTRLNTFGLVDPEEGIYRIPIDSAITIMAQEAE
jgi:hypothetical protein